MYHYLDATEFFDYHHPAFEKLLSQFKTHNDEIELATSIYAWVRDQYAYNPYLVTDGADSFKASYCLEKGQGYCIPKAALMVALCRRLDLPARIGLADVKNHLSTPKLDALLKTDIFSMHGYVEVYLQGGWVKATPAFNASLCYKTGTEPLEFDGLNDSIFHAFTPDGQRHMEYITDYGTFDEMPVSFIFSKFDEHYPHLFKNNKIVSEFAKADAGTSLESEINQ